MSRRGSVPSVGGAGQRRRNMAEELERVKGRRSSIGERLPSIGRIVHEMRIVSVGADEGAAGKRKLSIPGELEKIRRSSVVISRRSSIVEERSPSIVERRQGETRRNSVEGGVAARFMWRNAKNALKFA